MKINLNLFRNDFPTGCDFFSTGYPVVNDPLYNHSVFGPEKGKGGRIGKSDEKLIADLISIHNAENWLGLDEDGLGPVQPGSIIGQNIQLREPEGTY